MRSMIGGFVISTQTLITPRTLLLAVLAALCAGALRPEAAAAQYFGRNQVRYHDLDFQVLETEHFDVYHYEREAGSAELAASMAERWYTRLSGLMEHQLTGRQPFILYASHPHFRQTTAVSGRIGQGTGGVTEPLNRRVVLPMAGPLSDTDHVIGHELVHAFQYDLGGVTPGAPRFGAPTISRLPLWLVEGMAEYLSRGPESAMTAMWMRDALLTEDPLPSIRDLRNARTYFPYRYGHAFLSYIGGHWGESAVMQLFRQTLDGSRPAAALSQTLGVPGDSVASAWHRSLRETYGPVQDVTGAPDDVAEPIFDPDDVELDVGPALSPDGRRLLFLSQRDPLSIDLYLADATTGEIIRRVTRSALDPHYHSLQFINSAGAWAPDGRRFAFAAVQSGQPIISIMDADTGDRLRTLRFPDLGAAFNPTWSPDGGRIAFVANDGGVLDLWVAEVATGELRRVTDDAYAELHPDWSPDGRRIAVATDRFTTDLDALGMGRFRLATIDVETGRATAVASFHDARNINPRWGPGGESLFFIADPGGIPNVYRLDVGSGTPVPLTNLYVGASGITEVSPVLAVARESGRLVFTAYRNGKHALYRMDDAPAARAARSGSAPIEGRTLLPPPSRSDDRLIGVLRRPDLGLPDPAGFHRRDYRASLSLDYIAQPSLGFGISSYGSFIGGGAAFLFSDMLGRHSLTAQLQLAIRDGNVLNGIGLMGRYLNRSSRTSWGVIAGQIPRISRSIRRDTGDVDNDGTTEFIQETFRFWQVNRQLKGLAIYPFSPTLRLEASGGLERTDYVLETDRQVFSPTATGFTRDSDRTIEAPACASSDTLSLPESLCEPGPLNQAVATVALVQDNAIVGPTGPVAGQRFRVEASPSYGTLQYTSTLADFRRYIRVAEPLTLAGRGLHFGRYGSDARDDRLTRLFLGHPTLIRGYGRDSFDASVCPPDTRLARCSEVQVLDQLFGSRLAVANAEARLAVFGPLGVLGTGFLPMDLIGFYDAGVAWTSDSRASFLGGPRELLTSAGAGLRFNLMGFFLAEVHWVRPFDRPAKGGYIAFNINSGF
ncbi:MAG: BamA/TamA family outer membrane protein [Longimicrobiales bacterium]